MTRSAPCLLLVVALELSSCLARDNYFVDDRDGPCAVAAGELMDLGAFSAAPALPEPFFDAAAARTKNGKAYFVGGWASTTGTARLVLGLDRAGAEFKSEPLLPYGLTEHGLVYLADRDSLLAIGGDFAGGDYSDGTHLLTPGDTQWRQGPPLPRGRIGPAAAVTPTCGVIVVRGTCPGGELCAESLRWDPGVSGWRTVAEMPTPRANANALLGADGLVYVIGGWTGNALTGAVEVYFPNQDRWESRTPMPTPRRFAAAVLAPDGRFYVAGGTTSAGNTNALERYDPRTDAWTATDLPRLSQVRRSAAAVVLGRSLVVAGGASGAEGLVSVEVAGFSQ